MLFAAKDGLAKVKRAAEVDELLLDAMDEQH
jgi:hypothetical protein